MPTRSRAAARRGSRSKGRVDRGAGRGLAHAWIHFYSQCFGTSSTAPHSRRSVRLVFGIPFGEEEATMESVRMVSCLVVWLSAILSCGVVGTSNSYADDDEVEHYLGHATGLTNTI